ncbi:MAG: MFS transporter [Bacteroidota bacterium]|nr:MFS transporter [Bacteroidota bacterium]MDP4233552.1 MFS transporter [Bacteroidota bacterium]MDP4243673.1 MFS transporter [Bacteroidota bacterium]MDP4287738.1 MFS transporter [Bacteroidota bacterium]
MLHDRYAVLKIPDYRSFQIFRFLLTLGLQIQVVVVGWHVYALTHDPLALGLTGLAEAIPAIGFAIYGGYVADRHSRKRITIWSIAVMALAAVMLCYLSTSTTWFAAYGAWPVYLTIFFGGIPHGFLTPAATSFGTQLVPKHLYANAATWNSTTWQTAAIIGPAIGGVMYGFAGVTASYASVVVLLAAALLAIARVQAPHNANQLRGESVIKSVKAGFRFVFDTPLLLSAISLDLFAVLFGGAVSLLPVFASDVLHVGPEAYGMMRAAPSIGAVLMAAILIARPIGDHFGRSLLFAVAGFGVAIIIFGLSRNFYLSVAMLVVSGALDNVSVVARFTILQSLTPDSMRGRVSAINSMFIGSSNEIGGFESGLAAKLMGLVPSVIFGGLMTIGVVIGTAILVPQLGRMKKSDIVLAEI